MYSDTPRDGYKFGLKNTWYFDHFNRNDELLGLVSVMGVRATPAAAAFFADLIHQTVQGEYLRTDSGSMQTQFNILIFRKGLRIDKSTLEGLTNLTVQNTTLHLKVSVVCEETFLSPCQSSIGSPRPSFAHANCMGDPGENPTYAEHAMAKERWMKENGFWFPSQAK